ncbi:MAG: radical SAM protein [Verrucomicrobia bacterium]|nr:radical SAM protein [Verrucomicrobiota bacterium]
MFSQRCELCPRRCGVNRNAGKVGHCKGGSVAEIFRYGAHHGEEPPVSGTKGSGTVFFSRCTLGCLYCQNFPWSQEGRGERYGDRQLIDVFRSLAAQGCHNWNLVSPTPWLPLVKRAIDALAREGISLPVVYNTSGFENLATLRDYEGMVDLWLTDLRYSRRESALAGSGSAGYVEVARAALKEMWRQKGAVITDSNGIGIRGTICRLLILPGKAAEVVENLEWLTDNVGTDIAVSVMSQYIPAHKAPLAEPWKRRISLDEYTLVCDAVERLGFDRGWIQDFEGTPPEELVGFQMKSGANITNNMELTHERT